MQSGISSLRSILRSIFMASVLVVAVHGCSEVQPEGPSVEEPGYISVRLRSASHLKAKSEPGLSELNENKISTAVLCLYPSVNPSGKPVFVKSFSLEKDSEALIEVKLSKDLRDVLFPSGTTSCGAYVVANLPEETASSITVNTLLDDIRKIKINDDFASSVAPESFVMDGSTDAIVLSGAGTLNESASGRISLQRAASKITIAADVAESVTVGEGENAKIWTPQTENIAVLITNGVKGSAVMPSTYTPGAADYYATSDADQDPLHRSRRLSASGTADYPYALQNPFYTFPNRWSPDDTETPMTYMTLMVPWRKEGEDRYRMCYYMVPVTRQNSIGRNISYRVNIKVNMLGSFTPDEPLLLEELSYTAVDWSEAGTDVEISDFRYLVVDQERYVLNNEPATRIIFYTSHPVKVSSVSMTYNRFNTTAQGFRKEITITEAQYKQTQDKGKGNIYTCSIQTPSQTDANNYIVFDHPLYVWTPYDSNDAEVDLTGLANENQVNTNIGSISYYARTDEAAFSDYTTTITIEHTDNDAYSETITVVQYPAVYITSTPNKYNGTSAVSAIEGNMFCNGSQNGSTERWYVAYGLAGAQSSTNRNPNQYVINVTQLDPSTDYIIGDPREDECTDMYGCMTWTSWGVTHYFGEDGSTAPYRNWASAPALYGDSPRRLKYYYPTDDSKDKARWIAPAFRIASSYGVCYENTYDQDKARCASYQEMGKPAGRWRIPTVAEIEFIMNLSETGKIPTLFNKGTNEDPEYYMSAQGRVHYNSDTGKLDLDTGNAAVRCVYDEWFWKDDDLTPGTDGRYVFTWGDRPRTGSQE